MLRKISREVTIPTPEPGPRRVIVRETPLPGDGPTVGEAQFEDPSSIASARKSRVGGYLKLPLQAVRAIGKSAILLEKIVEGTDLILRVRLFPVPIAARR